MRTPVRTNKNLRRCAALAFACLAVGAGAARADQPLWELGIGAAALSLPHYPGSDQSHSWVLPIPYFVYRGDVLRADRKGARAVLLETERVTFDINAAATPPTKSSDDRARSGMPDLKATVELGPRLNLTLARGSDWQLHLRVPVRGVFTVESSPRGIGATVSPVLDLDLRAGGWDLGVQGGMVAATRAYNAYFYDVVPAYATDSRPAYATRGGYAGWHLSTAAWRRAGRWWLAGYARIDSVAGTVFEGSPLVRRRTNASVGLAASWVFAKSSRSVADRN
jgi:MipA family protein